MIMYTGKYKNILDKEQKQISPGGKHPSTPKFNSLPQPHRR